MTEQAKDFSESTTKAVYGKRENPDKRRPIVLIAGEKHGDESTSLIGVPRDEAAPRAPERATDFHDHFEVVAALKWRGDLREAARGAHSIPICPSASNLCNHDRAADPAPHKVALAFLTRHICGHASTPSVRDYAARAPFCDAAKGRPPSRPRSAQFVNFENDPRKIIKKSSNRGQLVDWHRICLWGF